jgi:hypothetical protein
MYRRIHVIRVCDTCTYNVHVLVLVWVGGWVGEWVGVSRGGCLAQACVYVCVCARAHARVSVCERDVCRLFAIVCV